MNCIQQESKRNRAEWQSWSAAKGGGEQTQQEPGNPFPAVGTRRSWDCTKATLCLLRCDMAAVLGAVGRVWMRQSWQEQVGLGGSKDHVDTWPQSAPQGHHLRIWCLLRGWRYMDATGIRTGIIFPPPSSKPMCTSTGRVAKWMGKGKIQKGLRRDGTELASGILSTIIKRIREQSSKRTQRRQEKMCSGMHNQEYPIQTRGTFPSTPQGLPGPFWEMC